VRPSACSAAFGLQCGLRPAVRPSACSAAFGLQCGASPLQNEWPSVSEAPRFQPVPNKNKRFELLITPNS
jgi:hypothetical protein